MGKAAGYFYSSNDASKETLHRRITPSNEQLDEQKDRWGELAEFLKQYLAAATGLPIKTWLQGSYKFRTQIRPISSGGEFDIDLGFYFLWSGKAADGDYEPNELKSLIQDGLFEYSTDNSEVKEVVDPSKERCSRVRYDGSFHIDLPAYHLEAEDDARSLATATNGWEYSDPKAIYVWFKKSYSSDIDRGKARRAIQYLKSWVELTFRHKEGPSSILLTVLVTEAFLKLSSDAVASDDDALQNILSLIVARLDENDEVINPVDENEVLSDRMRRADKDRFKDELRSISLLAEAAVSSDNVLDAWASWAAVFQHLFPSLDEPESIQDLSSLPAITCVPEIHILATSRVNSSIQWTGKNEIGPITKDCQIVFSVTNTSDFPGSAVFTWVVRNEGEEAENKFDLGHVGVEGPVKTERSAYKGTHSMDCIVKHLGKVIGYRRVPVTILGYKTPPRNNSKRPSYRSFASGRR